MPLNNPDVLTAIKAAGMAEEAKQEQQETLSRKLSSIRSMRAQRRATNPVVEGTNPVVERTNQVDDTDNVRQTAGKRHKNKRKSKKIKSRKNKKSRSIKGKNRSFKKTRTQKRRHKKNN